MGSSEPTKRKGSFSEREKRRKKGSLCRQDGDDSQPAKVRRQSIPELPEEILVYIHYLMPMREAARAACVSRAFLRSWRDRPNLILDEHTFVLNPSVWHDTSSPVIETILRNHSGIGVKVFKLDSNRIRMVNIGRYLDSWIQVALKPGIQKFTLMVNSNNTAYNFPCSLLSDGIRSSTRYLKLGSCDLHPAAELGPFRSLTSLCLWDVSISGDELDSLLSNCLSLEQVEINRCLRIIGLKISCTLEQLSSLRIDHCRNLKMIESNAPNLSRFLVRGNTEFSLGKALQMTKLDMDCPNAVHYARAKLPSIVPNLETLVIGPHFTEFKVDNTPIPMLPNKLFCLKHLTLGIFRPYDFLSLVSLLDASPSLEALTLDVTFAKKSTLGDDASRCMPEHRHGCLKCVSISKFSAKKSLVELTRYILMCAVSLECLTLDTAHGHFRLPLETSDRCGP